MKALLITYDLGAPGQKYASLIARIKTFGAWLHALESTWFVVTDASPAQVEKALSPMLDQTDSLLVLDVTDDDWAGWHNTATGNWLRAHVAAYNPVFG